MKYLRKKLAERLMDKKSLVGQLEELEGRYNQLKENIVYCQELIKTGSWTYNIRDGTVFWSDEIFRILEIGREGLDDSLESLYSYIHPNDLETLIGITEKKVPIGKEYDIEYRVTVGENRTKHLYEKVKTLYDEGGTPIKVIGIIQDISNRKIVENDLIAYGTIQDITEKKELENRIVSHRKELDKVQRRFQVLVQESNDVFEILSSDGSILYISAAVERVMGYRADERVGRNIFDYYEGKELEKIKSLMSSVQEEAEKRVRSEISFVTKSGKKIYLEIYMQNLLHEANINGIVVNFRDISQRVRMEKRMVHISTHDGLTDLPNSIYCTKRLRLEREYARKRNSKFALMMIDIDGLKYATYSLGYEFGESLILEIVERLRADLGDHRFLSRHSDDHFAVIVSDIDKMEEYESLANQIIGLFRDTYRIKDYELDINVNIGIAIYPNDGEEIQELRNHAKIALIRAKKEGKNTYKFYSSDLDIQNYKEFVLRSDLHNALEEGQLKVYYQPIVNIKTNKILGTEALVRWEHPEWGLVESEEFISLAEDTGKIIDIGKWVLRRVCKDYKQWLVDGLADIKVSVNFSAVQFLEKDFVENIKKIIGEFDLAPNFLIMEITENILLANVEKANSDINRLRDMGIQIAMDDFGTGYSSLIYLNSFNIDIIKLDKSFIKNIPENIGSVAITKTVVKLAKELKLRFVAEGIETYDQLQLLKSLNAIGGQGFLYSEARPVEEFEKILRKRVCKPAAFLGLDATPRVERRKLFRVKFTQLLEADLTILEIKGKKINVGNTKVLVKDMGPGGLCFISNIRFPVERDMTLQFKTDLIGEEIVVYGHPVWTEQIDSKAHKYGIKFEVDENERMELVRVLNSVQIKMRKNVLFAEGSFFPGNHLQYFEAFQKSI